MFERIVVAVDGSNASMRGLEHAVALQGEFDSELLVLCVYRHYSLLEASMSTVRPQAPENLEESMRDCAAGIVKHAKEKAAQFGAKRVQGFVGSGPPARTIVEFAKDKGADLIVLGSRGLGDVEKFLLGSVSHKVTGLAECPTLVV